MDGIIRDVALECRRLRAFARFLRPLPADTDRVLLAYLAEVVDADWPAPRAEIYKEFRHRLRRAGAQALQLADRASSPARSASPLPGFDSLTAAQKECLFLVWGAQFSISETAAIQEVPGPQVVARISAALARLSQLAEIGTCPGETNPAFASPGGVPPAGRRGAAAGPRRRTTPAAARGACHPSPAAASR